MADRPELRSHPRAPILLRVEYRRVNSFLADYTKNISKGGTFITTATPLPVGTRFRFVLTLPGSARPWEMDGEVVRAIAEPTPSEPDIGMGVRFVFSDPELQLAFEREVEALMMRALGPQIAQQLLKK